MSEIDDTFREHSDELKERKAKEGIPCPRCKQLQPKRSPTILLLGWRCKVDGYRRPLVDPRKNALGRWKCPAASNGHALTVYVKSDPAQAEMVGCTYARCCSEICAKGATGRTVEEAYNNLVKLWREGEESK